MIYMTAEQAAEFFEDGDVPANVAIRTEAEIGAYVASIL